MRHRITWLITIAVVSVISTIALLGSVSTAHAANLVVGIDCPTIQTCINIASTGDTVFIPSGTYNESLSLNKRVNLRGSNQTTTFIQPPAGQRVLWVDSAAVTSLAFVANLTLRNGDVSVSNVCFPFPTNCGGGILLTNGAQPRLINLTLQNNQAFQGGGIYADAGTVLDIDNVTLRNNSAVLSGGGAYLLEGATIADSLFENNSSLNNVAGGLRVSGDTVIDNTTFRGNQTCTVGGSICHAAGLYGFEVNLTVSNSLFEDNICNHSDCDGGGLYLSSSFVTVTLSLVDTDFVNNNAGRAGGGAVANSFRVNTMVSGGRFEGNQAGIGDGGGMSAYRVVLSGTQFLTNTSGSTQTFDEGGGGLNVQDTAVLTNTLFQGNHSDRGGGGFAAFLGPISMHNATFRNNTADENGGGAYVELLDVTVTDSLFEGNSTLIAEIINDDGIGNGGGLWAGGDVALTNVNMTNNTATNRGGGLFTPLGASRAVTVNGGLIQGNKALGTELIADGGGGMFLTNETLVLDSTQIRDNEAMATGGGGILNFGVTTDNNSLFQGNQALYGGGVYAVSTAVFSGTQVISNSAINTGGGILMDDSAEFTNVLFQQNSSTGVGLGQGNGGGLSANNPITLTNVQFISNTAVGSTGGGAFVFGSVVMIDTLFRGNQSAGSGGGLTGSFDVVTINNSQFISNTAVSNGGGLQSSGNIFLTNALFQENHSDGNGGGLYTSGSVFLTDSNFLSNTAGVDGGGAFVNSNTDFVNGRFQNNNSGARGGGMYSGSFFVINGTEFLNNNAGTRGGGGYSNFDVTLTNGRFQNNTAQEAGGGVFVRRRANISQTMFIRNQAQLGGGLAISGTLNGTFFDQIDNTLFAQNQAGVGGAGLYMNSCGPSTCRPLYIFHITIASPTPTANQAILVANGNISVTNAILANHAVGMEKVGGGTAVADFINYFGNTTNEMGVTGTNLVLGNSTFVSTNDYRLVQGSAALDAGTDVGIVVDIRGFPRPTGAGFDMGAYEGAHTPTAVTLTTFYVHNSQSTGLWLALLLLVSMGFGVTRWKSTSS